MLYMIAAERHGRWKHQWKIGKHGQPTVLLGCFQGEVMRTFMYRHRTPVAQNAADEIGDEEDRPPLAKHGLLVHLQEVRDRKLNRDNYERDVSSPDVIPVQILE